MSDLFNDKPLEQPAEPKQPDLPQESYFDHLVGDGKKFSSGEGLARGKYESDLYVSQLQSENASMRAALQEQESVSELLDKALGAKPAVAPEVPAPPVVEQGAAPVATGITQDELAKLVETQVNSRLNAQEKQANIDHVHKVAEAAYGPEYAKELSKKAEELGIGQQFLSDIAGDQPAAFIELMVPKEPTATLAPVPTAPSIPTGSIQSVPGVTGAKTMADYNSMSKKMTISEFYTPAIQNEIFAAAKAQGEDFFKT